MIFDHINNAYHYEHMHKGFKEAFEFIKNFQSTQLEAQRISLDEQNLIAIIEPGEGRSHAGAKLEAHKKYIDIQYSLEGHEVIGWKPHHECQSITKPYNPEKDIEFFSDTSTIWLPMPPGFFAIFFPTDAHAPLAGNGSVRKIIMKVAVEEQG